MILSELAPLVSAQHGVFYSMTNPPDGGEPVLELQAGYGYEERKHLVDFLPAGRGPGRPVRQGEEADPAHRGPERLREDQLRARRVASAEHHRPAGAVRGVGARRRRARLLLALQRHPPGVPRLRSRRASASSSTRSRRTPSPRTCSSSPSRRPRSSARSRRSCASRTRISAGRPRCSPSRTSRRSRRTRRSSSPSDLVEEKAGQLAVSSKYKSEFIANMSHELRTPLNSLLILAEQLEDNPDDNMTDRQVEYASVIHASGKELLELLNSILDLAKVESGTVTADALDVSVGELRSALLREFEPVATSEGLGYSIDVAPDSARAHRHRPATPPPDPQEPARQRVQVHRAGQGAGAGRPGRERLEPAAWNRSPTPPRSCRSPSPTPASASEKRSNSGSSRRSRRATAPPRACTVARASAFR